ncbi:MAG: hypothetical protein JOY82_27910 [Streptosporangiaceae bacterium]|nr:hypothetical protein [Streptosporangiaceae bacterium]
MGREIVIVQAWVARMGIKVDSGAAAWQREEQIMGQIRNRILDLYHIKRKQLNALTPGTGYGPEK